MSLAPFDAKRSPWTDFQRGVSRERALIAVFDRAQKSVGQRAARFYASCIFLGYALAILLSRAGDRRALIQGLVQAALVALSWGVGAPVALATARTLAQPSSPNSDALAALALARGYSQRSLVRARALSAAARVARGVALPGVLLVAVSVLRGATLLWALSVAPAVIVYASTLGLSLAGLALFSAELTPRRPRTLLAFLVLAPLLLAQAFPGFPVPISLLSSLLGHLLDSGAQLT